MKYNEYSLRHNGIRLVRLRSHGLRYSCIFVLTSGLFFCMRAMENATEPLFLGARKIPVLGDVSSSLSIIPDSKSLRVKKFKCFLPGCTRAYRRDNELRRHQRTHDAVSTPCPLNCGAIGHSIGALGAHLRDKHKGDIPRGSFAHLLALKSYENTLRAKREKKARNKALRAEAKSTSNSDMPGGTSF